LKAKTIHEFIVAFGHENIQSIHPSTLMFTKEKTLSKNGDCIIGVAADKAGTELSKKFKDALRMPNAKLTICIEVGNLKEQIVAFGYSKMSLTHQTDVVIRKSDFISDRTLAINADKSSNDLPRAFVQKLKNPKQKINIMLAVNV
jgi:hypothetical protein